MYLLWNYFKNIVFNGTIILVDSKYLKAKSQIQ